ncbi:hypothetical protein FE236_02330 [Mariprofundus erugo]|uniref:restriction endonuclease subunit S n=1 Tax=Mariprofundus erugo TaxID=2528639 RepID=UPI0010FD952F|nr:restriction endonuclease subunit S [Mariprofundus erugo]TLS77946.1 hypothetical protein FE236_02330 [Mariprofundus erugo]
MTLKTYPSYKGSGIDWLGEIPAHWACKFFKRFGNFKAGAGFPNEDQGCQTGEVPFYKVSDMNLAGNEVSMICSNNWVSRDVAKRLGATVFPAGTIILPKVGAALLTNKRRVLGVDACIDNNVMGFILQHGDVKWLYYLFLMLDLKPLTNPGALPSINESQIERIRVCLPPIEEQQAIAAYLDEQTSKLDRLIANKRKHIKQLETLRKVTIQNAVTKGLNPDAPMKDSGIDWLGEIPAHWSVRRFRKILHGNLVNGLFKKKDDFGSGTLLVNVFDIYRDDFLVSSERLDRVEASESEICSYKVESGDLFFVRSSLKREGVGRSACVLDTPEPMVFECHLVRGRLNATVAYPRYINYLLNSSVFNNILVSKANIVTMATIDQAKIQNLPSLCPPVPEQQAIAAYLDEQTSKLDRLLANKREQIKQLETLRKVTIQDAVTGKIMVPGVEV